MSNATGHTQNKTKQKSDPNEKAVAVGEKAMNTRNRFAPKKAFIFSDHPAFLGDASAGGESRR